MKISIQKGDLCVHHHLLEEIQRRRPQQGPQGHRQLSLHGEQPPAVQRPVRVDRRRQRLDICHKLMSLVLFPQRRTDRRERPWVRAPALLHHRHARATMPGDSADSWTASRLSDLRNRRKYAMTSIDTGPRAVLAPIRLAGHSGVEEKGWDAESTWGVGRRRNAGR